MTRTGGCNCGWVRFTLEGEPLRVGLCHCETCRKFTGSAFSHYGVWPKAAVTITGDLACWEVKAGGDRFCPRCGSSLATWTEAEDEIEVKLGTLDGPSNGLAPDYELWVVRREPWLGAMNGALRWEKDREG